MTQGLNYCSSLVYFLWVLYLVLFVCVDALHSSQQFFSHVGDIFLSSRVETMDEMFCVKNTTQWHSKNAEKVNHIKGRLLEKDLILFNCIPFQNKKFS